MMSELGAGRGALVMGAVLGAAAVGLGAFAAHGLRARVSAEDLAIFETGARYQMYHALALWGLGAAWAAGAVTRAGAARVAMWAWVLGGLVFSGSLYVLVLSGARWWGAVTPVGGVALIVGWAAAGWSVWRRGGGGAHVGTNGRGRAET